MTRPRPDWKPLAPEVANDPLGTFDQMRRTCPVAFSEELGWSVFRHADVRTVAEDHTTFSNEVSQHLSVPNGMDPPEHTRFRTLIDPYFAPERVERFAATFRAIAAELVAALPDGESEVMESLANPFAARVQCAFMGWPDRLYEPLRAWTAASHEATRAQDRPRLTELAEEFDTIISAEIDARRRRTGSRDLDTTAQLLSEQVDGRPLTDDELVSVIRNWTAGEVGTIAASIGILVRHLAEDSALQHALRTRTVPLSPAIDEVLRLDGPLLTNRRRTTRAVELGGRTIEAGARITLAWPAANRDEEVFGEARFAPGAHAADNLLYGAGIHICPGAPLARRELEIFVEELLAGTRDLLPASGPPTRARYPTGGFATVPVRVTFDLTRDDQPRGVEPGPPQT